MEKVQRFTNTKCNISSSEVFRIEQQFSLSQYLPHGVIHFSIGNNVFSSFLKLTYLTHYAGNSDSKRI
jgi:hypothetical protein